MEGPRATLNDTEIGGEAPKNIPTAEKLKLWVRSGGRCAICNKYLLEDEFTGHSVNLGELAHNVGRKRSASSPRGEEELEIDKRNLAENLLLLCDAHHKTIDAKVLAGEYPVDELHEIKRRHEDRIWFLTNLREDAETVVLRVIGEVRGASVELSAEAARKAVMQHARRYPRYGLGFSGDDVEIDFRNLPAEGSDSYWSVAQQQIDAVVARLRDGVAKGEVRHVSVFALARIPLLVVLGHHLDDKVPTEIYQKQRGGDEDWRWDPDADPVTFQSVLLREGTDPKRVAVIISLSGTIDVVDLPRETNEESSIWAIRPIDITPNRDILRSSMSLKNFARCYHGFLSLLEQEHPGADAVDVFPAVPVSAAVALGRGLMRQVHPALRIYERDESGEFRLAVETNNEAS